MYRMVNRVTLARQFVFFSLLLFMRFNARRKQRPIPIIEPLKNSTVEFTHTIANLYLKEKEAYEVKCLNTKSFYMKFDYQNQQWAIVE